MTEEQFKQLPTLAEGSSKIIKKLSKTQALIKLKPTIYSYTHNRAAEILGSDEIRFESSNILTNVLTSSGVKHAYVGFNNSYITSTLVNNTDVPPIEVIVKKYHEGTPKHRYYDVESYKLRGNEPALKPGSKYKQLVVRFDWRNPMTNSVGERLADEVMPEDMAEWYIDVVKAKKLALKSFNVLSDFLNSRGIELVDICFMITADGKQLYGEVSPDCMRVRDISGDSLDKDVWRRGGSSDEVLVKWNKFLERIS